MEIFIAEQCKSLAESCILGLIFGAGYDIIRILYVLCGIQSYTGRTESRSKAAFWLFLAGDLLFMLTAAIGASVFLYHVNHGRFRLFLALGCIIGFRLYQCTLGRLVMHLSEAIVRLIKRIVYHTVIRPVRGIYRVLCAGIRLLVRYTLGRLHILIKDMVSRRRIRRCIRHFPEFVQLQTIK